MWKLRLVHDVVLIYKVWDDTNKNFFLYTVLCFFFWRQIILKQIHSLYATIKQFNFPQSEGFSDIKILTKIRTLFLITKYNACEYCACDTCWSVWENSTHDWMVKLRCNVKLRRVHFANFDKHVSFQHMRCLQEHWSTCDSPLDSSTLYHRIFKPIVHLQLGVFVLIALHFVVHAFFFYYKL